jgi:hypothetical protein
MRRTVTTSPVKVPEAVHGEVQAIARPLGCNSAELLERAWSLYRESPDFCSDFEHAQERFRQVIWIRWQLVSTMKLRLERNVAPQQLNRFAKTHSFRHPHRDSIQFL